MIYLTQLLYVHPGCEAELDAFEAVALPLMGKYGGELVLRLRPDAGSVIGGTGEAPYEVHVIRFESDEGVARFAADEERQRVLHRKDASVLRVVLIRGTLQGPAA